MKKPILIICLLFLCFACNKNNESNYLTNNGLIYFTGELALDGCGWLITIDSVVYAPDELDSAYQIDSLPVIIKYEMLNTSFICGWSGNGIPQIEIVKIEKQ